MCYCCVFVIIVVIRDRVVFSAFFFFIVQRNTSSSMMLLFEYYSALWPSSWLEMLLPASHNTHMAHIREEIALEKSIIIIVGVGAVDRLLFAFIA